MKKTKMIPRLVMTTSLSLFPPLVSLPVIVNVNVNDQLPMAHMINDVLANRSTMEVDVHGILQTCHNSQTALKEAHALYDRVEQLNPLYRSAHSFEPNYYEILDIPTNIRSNFIKEAYEHDCAELEQSALELEDKKSKKDQLDKAYSILGNEVSRKNYDETHVQYLIDDCINRHKKQLCGDHDYFLKLLHDNRNFLGVVFTTALAEFATATEKPIMIQFLEQPALDKDFFDIKINSLEALIRFSNELFVFSRRLQNSFSPEIKKRYNIWAKERFKAAHTKDVQAPA